MKDESGTAQVTTALIHYGTIGDCGISTAKFTCRACGQDVDPMAAHYCVYELFKMVKAIESRIAELETKLEN